MSNLKKSPWIIHYDGSSCNGCDIEVLACLMPVYDVERFGVVNTGNPKHADIFLVTGAVNEQNKEIIQNIYNQMPDPKVVVAIGACAGTGGIFSECYNVTGGIDKVIPVDVFVPGCAARPEAIIDGVVKALDVLEEKNKRLRAMSTGLASMSIERAEPKDLKEILALQKTAFQSEAEIYNDFSIAPLNQSLDELTADFKDKIFLKAVIDGTIIGSVRAEVKANRCFIGRLIVDPHFQNFGVGTRLMHAIEEACGDVGAYELHTGHKSKRNLFFYKKLGYKKFKSLKISESITRIFLEKNRR